MPMFDGRRRRPFPRRPLRPTMSEHLHHLRLLISVKQRVRPAVYVFFSHPYELVPSPIFKHRFDFDAAGVRMRVMAREMPEIVEIDHREYQPFDHTRNQKSVRYLPFDLTFAKALPVARTKLSREDFGP